MQLKPTAAKLDPNRAIIDGYDPPTMRSQITSGKTIKTSKPQTTALQVNPTLAPISPAAIQATRAAAVTAPPPQTAGIFDGISDRFSIVLFAGVGGLAGYLISPARKKLVNTVIGAGLGFAIHFAYKAISDK